MSKMPGMYFLTLIILSTISAQEAAAANRTLTKWSNGNMRGFTITHVCPPGYIVKNLAWKEQHGYGLVDVRMDCGYGSARRFTNNGNGFWNREAACHNYGFSWIIGEEQHGYGIVNAKSSCTDKLSVQVRSNGNNNGFVNQQLKCPADTVVVGLNVREQHGYGIINFKLVCETRSATGRTWTGWSNGNMRGFTIRHVCPPGYVIENLAWKEQHGYGLVDVRMDCGYGSATRFTNNGNGFWNTEAACHNYGFSWIVGEEQHGYGIVNAKSSCTDKLSVQVRSNGNNNGFVNQQLKCPADTVVVGLIVREQHGYGIINFKLACGRR